MKIKDCMTPNVRVVNPDMSLCEAAKIMSECDTGVLPVGEGDQLVGMITDRDIAIRAVAQGKGPDCKVGDVMTCEVKYCFEDESIDHVAKNMGDIQVRRLPVMNRDKRLVGIVSLGDIAASGKNRTVGEALGDVCRPSSQHNQSESVAATH